MTLKELRKEKGFTQEKLAQAIREKGYSMTTQNLRNYEYGSYKNMNNALEQIISDILGVEFHYQTY